MGIWRKQIVEETKKQIWLAGPMVFVCLFQNSLQIISLMFVGRLNNELLLAGTSLGTSFVNVAGFNVMMGMSSALDTFCGQAYGAQQYDKVGIYTQRAMLVTTLVSVPLSLILAYLKPILILLHQDKAIATQAGIFALYSIPSLPANGFVRCLIKFLQSQNIVFPMVLVHGIICLTHILLSWALVLKVGLGIKGAAIAICISNWVNVILLALYIWFSKECKETWVGFSKEALHHIPPFFRLAFPSTVMICLESWTFELMVLLSGALPNPALQTSVLSICVNICGMLWMVPFGVSVAGSTRISNELGAGYPKAAYVAVIVTLFLAFTTGLLEFALLMSVWKVWGKAFTHVSEVITYVTSMTPVLAVTVFIDSLQTALQGVIRGCGWQKFGAYVNLGSYYLLGIPFSAVFAFVLHMKGQGLFLGILIALIMQVVCFFIVTMRTSWEKEANKAAIRVGGNGVQVNALPNDQNVTP